MRVSVVTEIVTAVASDRIGRKPFPTNWQYELLAAIARRTSASWVLFFFAIGSAFSAGAAIAAISVLRRVPTSGNVWIEVLLIGLFLAGLLVVLPSVLFRLIHFGRHEALISKLRELFAKHRVTHTEWAEAKRLIRESGDDLLDFGVDRHFDAKCLL